MVTWCYHTDLHRLQKQVNLDFCINTIYYIANRRDFSNGTVVIIIGHFTFPTEISYFHDAALDLLNTIQ